MNIFAFGLGEPSQETSPEILGGKGAGLVWMDKQGVSVPPGFIIPTNVCQQYQQAPKTMMKQIAQSIKPWLVKLHLKMGYMPLLSVRSGARVSMPGMMDTILNVGLDETNAKEWVARIGETCTKDSRRRLIEMFGSVVQGYDRNKFEGLSARQARDVYCTLSGESAFPNAELQLLGSIEAVFKSWNNERAKVYRKLHSIPEDWGTAVVVQTMVFGNLNDKSCTGVLFTRNPDSGENVVTGEFLVNAQGEDVVAGIRTPVPLKKMSEWNAPLATELMDTVTKLEIAKTDTQDVEFTVQDGKLFILQTRNAKRSSQAAIRIAIEMLDEKLIDKTTVFKRISQKDYVRAQVPTIDPAFKLTPVMTGLSACSGIATGVVVKSSEAAVASKVPCILVTNETTPDDIAGIIATRGMITMTGGATSHAAVIARSMNKPCIVGIGGNLSDLPDNETISMDGATGRIWIGSVPLVSGASSPWLLKLNTLMESEIFIGKKDGLCCGIIDDKDGDVLDVSDLDIPTATKTLITLLKTKTSIIVDTRPADTVCHKSYADMFGGNQEQAMVQALFPWAGPKVTFVSTVPVASGVQLIATVKTPEDLVMAKGDFILGVFGAWVDKLVDWKKQLEGVTAVRFGELHDGRGYISRAQLAQFLLSK